MNRIIRLTTLTFASILALTPLASAQQVTSLQQVTPLQQAHQFQSRQFQSHGFQSRQFRLYPGNAGPGRSAASALVREVSALDRLGHTRRTALSGEQARRLSALLSPLETASTLSTARATDLSASIDRLLTPAQRAALAQAGHQMGGHRMGGHTQGQGGWSQRGQAGSRQPGDQQGPLSQRGGAGMAPGSNPFLNGRGSHVLSHLLGRLQK